LSHFLTYYTLGCIGIGVRPLLPSRDIRHNRLDLLLAMLSLAGSSIIAIYTCVRCHQEWQFVLLAVWKLILSCNLGAACVHRARSVRKRDKTLIPMLWMLVSIPGTIIGLTGLISLILRSWDDHRLRVITAVFGAAVVFFAVVHWWYRLEWGKFDFNLDGIEMTHSMLCIWWICLLASLYSDWVLGLISGDLVGVPSGDIAALFWMYFMAKRLPLFFQ
jgi:hypothetical protein